jgi:hypothetical protein
MHLPDAPLLLRHSPLQDVEPAAVEEAAAAAQRLFHEGLQQPVQPIGITRLAGRRETGAPVPTKRIQQSNHNRCIKSHKCKTYGWYPIEMPSIRPIKPPRIRHLKEIFSVMDQKLFVLDPVTTFQRVLDTGSTSKSSGSFP